MNAYRIIDLNLIYQVAVAIKNILDPKQPISVNKACAVINQARLSGSLWRITKCWPSTNDKSIIFIQIFIEGEEWTLELRARKL